MLTGVGTEAGRAYVARTETAAGVAGVAAERLSQQGMQAKFPWFSFRMERRAYSRRQARGISARAVW